MALKQAENSVKIEGILSEIDLKTGSTVKNGKTMEYITGSIKVRVTQMLNGKDVDLDIPVYMFSNKLKNDGNPNPAYESIKRVKEEYVSIAAGGIDAADRVRITNANIRMNEYYGQGDKLNSYPRINASFVTKITDLSKFNPEATFSTVFMIAAMGPETDKDGIPVENRFKIRGILPQYGGKVDVIEFITANKNVINAIEQYWNVNDTVSAQGRLNFSSKTENVVKEVDFGEPQVTTRTISVSELVITGGSSTPLDGDFAYDMGEIQTALAERKAHLEETKNKNTGARKAPQPGATGPIDLGF
jgi:hypothetical protein